MTSQTSTTCAHCGKDATGNFCNHCGAPLLEQPCPTCEARLSPGARFCHVCGTPLGRLNSGGANPLVKNAGWIAAGVLTVALVIVLAARTSSGPPPQPIAAPTQARAPDISAMTPRARADRLFERIMIANEGGFPDTVAFFTPMALDAYRMIGPLDADARYHVGLINTLAGDLPQIGAQVDSLRQQDPNHLLGFMLDYALSSIQSDDEGSDRAYRDFLEAYDAEIARGLPEYEAHKPSIDAFLADAQAAR